MPAPIGEVISSRPRPGPYGVVTIDWPWTKYSVWIREEIFLIAEECKSLPDNMFGIVTIPICAYRNSVTNSGSSKNRAHVGVMEPSGSGI